MDSDPGAADDAPRERESMGTQEASVLANEGNGSGADDMEALLRDSDFGLRSLRRGETVEGTIVRVDEDEVLVDVGMKSEGVIPARELYGDGESDEPLHVGDTTLVYVISPEGAEGHAILSLRRARLERSWREIEDLFRHGTIVEAPVVDFNKGGLIVDVRGIRGFVPVSQILDLRNVARQEGDSDEINNTLSAMADRSLPLKIIEINRSRNRLILSERAAVQEQRTHRKDELLEQLEPGQIRPGVVSNLTSFGAFIDLGGADGLVHVSELSYNRINHPNEVLQVGQEVDVMVLSVDRDTKKIALSLKRALPDPWTTIDERYHLGQVVPATITKLTKFGAFAKLEDGLEGLIHLSELTDLPVQDASRVVQEGQQVQAKIIQINSARRRLGLSVRQAAQPMDAFHSFGDLPDENAFAAQFSAQNVESGVTDDEAVAIAPESATEEPEGQEDVEASETLTAEPENEATSPSFGEATTEQSEEQASEDLPSESESEPSPLPSAGADSPGESESAKIDQEQPEVASIAPNGSNSE